MCIFLFIYCFVVLLLHFCFSVQSNSSWQSDFHSKVSLSILWGTDFVWLSIHELFQSTDEWCWQHILNICDLWRVFRIFLSVLDFVMLHVHEEEQQMCFWDTFKLNVQETKYMVFCKARPMGFNDYYIVTSDGKTSERVHGSSIWMDGW